MALLLIFILLAAWLLYSGLKFYRTMDWNEKPESSPDLQQMHKRQAELRHIQDVLQKAREEEKVSQGFMDELRRYCDQEITSLQAIETAWINRRKK